MPAFDRREFPSIAAVDPATLKISEGGFTPLVVDSTTTARSTSTRMSAIVSGAMLRVSSPLMAAARSA